MLGAGPRQRSKVFWFFFSKKNCFLTRELFNCLGASDWGRKSKAFFFEKKKQKTFISCRGLGWPRG
jgi:hypothetical protein